MAAGATALHLERLRLLTIADGAALAAAESFRVADARVSGGTVVPSLDDTEVRAVAADYLGTADTPASATSGSTRPAPLTAGRRSSG